MKERMLTTFAQFFEPHWLGVMLALPIAVYAAWATSLVVPEVIKVVVPEVFERWQASRARNSRPIGLRMLSSASH